MTENLSTIEYEKIENNLKDFAKDHKLDRVTLGSLIRGTVEFEEVEPAAATTVYIDKTGEKNAVDIKAQNMFKKSKTFAIKFALDVIFSSKAIAKESEKIWFVLALLKTIVFLIEGFTIEFDSIDTRILICIYKSGNGITEDEIKTCLKKDENNADIKEETLTNSLKNLEKIGTVRMEDEKYYLNEKVVIH